ncbi:MAG: hypothetical protein J7527_19660, partial [Chitinophagaceae bacterium]|nr:hypothetical protein [Chitinophagaceae bacterium]
HIDHKAGLPQRLNFTFEEDEQILWSGRPSVKVFMLNSILKLFSVALFFIIIFLVCGLIVLATTKARWDVRETVWGFAGLSIFAALYVGREARRLKKTLYIITNKHVIIFSEFRNYSSTSIRINGLRSIEVKRSFFDRKFRTAQISLFSGEMRESEDGMQMVYDELYAVSNGEEVSALIKTYSNPEKM